MGDKTQQLISLGSVQEGDQSISAEVLEKLRAQKLSKLLAPHTKNLLVVCQHQAQQVCVTTLPPVQQTGRKMGLASTEAMDLPTGAEQNSSLDILKPLVWRAPSAVCFSRDFAVPTSLLS